MRRSIDLKKQILYFIFLFNLFGLTVCKAESIEEPPSVNELPGIISTIVGIFLSASIVILVIIIAYGVIKASLASGDPRGLEGAKSTWTYAVYGFIIVFFSFVIYSIILKVLGISGEGFQRENMFDIIIEPLEELIDISQSTSSQTP